MGRPGKERLPVPALCIAVVAIAFFTLPFIGLLWRAPWGSAWDAFVATIRRQGRRLTLLDLPGCGRSEPPAGWQRSTIDELALDVAELVRDSAMRDPVLVGHSLGGAIALQVAMNEPDLLSGLVLFAPASTTGLDFVPADAADGLAHPTPDDQRRLLRAAFHQPPDGDTLAALEAVVLRADPMHIEGAARSMLTFVVQSRLAEITAPSLVVAGDRDRHVPLRNHLATWAHLRRAGLHVEHEVGHVPFVEAAVRSAALVEHFIEHERRRPERA